jgi:hypothetical protein
LDAIHRDLSFKIGSMVIRHLLYSKRTKWERLNPNKKLSFKEDLHILGAFSNGTVVTKI